MKDFAETLLEQLRKDRAVDPIHTLSRDTRFFCRERTLLVVSDCRRRQPDGFDGEGFRLSDGGVGLLCPFSAHNATAIRRYFPWCVPSIPGGEVPTVELGSWQAAAERLNAAKASKLFPIFPPQSESDLSAADEAAFLVFHAGHRGGFAISGGRVTSAAALDKALKHDAGVVTLAPSPEETISGECEEYADKRFILTAHSAVHVSRETAKHIAAKFGGVVESASGKHPRFDLEVALEERGGAAHIYVIREFRKRNIDCAVIYPDYPAEPEAMLEEFHIHTGILNVCQGYKLGLRLAGITPEHFRELWRICNGRLHLVPDDAVWANFESYFPHGDLKA